MNKECWKDDRFMYCHCGKCEPDNYKIPQDLQKPLTTPTHPEGTTSEGDTPNKNCWACGYDHKHENCPKAESPTPPKPIEGEWKGIPLSTAMWAKMYDLLKKHGVKFPKEFDGIGASYAGLCLIDEAIESARREERERIKEIIERDIHDVYSRDQMIDLLTNLRDKE